MEQKKNIPDALPASFFLVVLALLALFISSNTPAVKQKQFETDKVIVRINDSTIMLSDFQREIGIIRVIAPGAMFTADDLYNNMLQNKIFDIGAAEMGISITPDELDESITLGLSSLGQTKEDFSASLLNEGVTWAEFEDWVEILVIRGKFQTALVSAYPQEQWNSLLQSYVFTALNGANIELVDEPALLALFEPQD